MVDLAYGGTGYALVSTNPIVRKTTTAFAYQTGMTGAITFNNARFGDPLVEVRKSGYYKPSYPFEVKKLAASNKWCLAIYPQRFARFLASLNADPIAPNSTAPNPAALNNSLVVNVDYTNIGPRIRRCRRFHVSMKQVNTE